MRSLDGRELQELLRLLAQPTALTEAGVLGGCLVAAWLAVRLIRGRTRPIASVWFGERIVDGVLFPVLALAFAFAARLALQSLLTPAVFRLAIPILISLVLIRLSARVLRATFPATPWVRRLERSISWAAWIAVVLWITGIGPLLLDAMGDVSWQFGTVSVTLRSLIGGVLTVGVVLVLVLWVSAAIERRLLVGTGANLSLRKMAASIVRVLMLFVGLMVALSAVGIDLTAFSVLGGAIGVGLGFGLQKIAANYVSGFVILAERSLRIGDMVKVDNFEGRITDIRTRYTVIRSLAGRESIVPNETLITQRVENASLADPRVLVSTVVQVDYGTDLAALLPQLEAAIGRVARVLADPAPAVRLSAFANDGLELTVQFWIRDPENGQLNVRSDVNLAILATLERAGVEIPYPQRVVRMQGAGANAPSRGPG